MVLTISRCRRARDKDLQLIVVVELPYLLVLPLDPCLSF
jgi:hypothetical protein